MRFKLIDAAKKEFPVQRLCKVLGVSPSGYFAWKSRPACRRQREDLVLLAHVRSAFALSNGTYGSPRMTHELRGQGLEAGRRRVARLMRENGLQSPAAAPLPAHDRQPSRLPGRAQPARPGLRGRGARREVGRGYLLRLDPGGLAVPGRCHGSLRPARGRLGGQRSAAQGTGARRAATSPRRAKTGGWPAPPFGPRQSILLY